MTETSAERWDDRTACALADRVPIRVLVDAAIRRARGLEQRCMAERLLTSAELWAAHREQLEDSLSRLPGEEP